MPKSVPISQALREWMDVFMHRSMSGWSHFVKSTHLSMPQFSILMQLYYRGPCGVSEISDRFETSPAAASQLVDKLVQSGLIERAEHATDRRVRQITLSKKGRTLIESGLEQRHRWMDELVENLSVAEKAKASEALILLTEAAQKLETDNNKSMIGKL